MAGDWIKMRVNLVTHPKVLAISEFLATSRDYQDWSTMSGFVPACGGSKAQYDRDFQESLRVTRYVTVCALLRFWGYANEHAKDEFITTLRVTDLDDIVQVPSFGEALESIQWVEYDEIRKGLKLPNFNEYNTSGNERSASAKSSAERQKEYRDRKKDAEKSDVTRDVTVTRNSNRREEKRREEKKNTNTTTAVVTPIGVSESLWTDFKKLRSTKKAPITQTAIDGIQREADKAGLQMADALAMCCERGWTGFKAEWALPDQQKPQPETFKERDARLGREKWERMTGEQHPDNNPAAPSRSILDVVDVEMKMIGAMQ